MIIIFILFYILFGTLTYETLSMIKEWPDLFDFLDKTKKEKRTQKEVNNLVLSFTFWPVWGVIGALCVIYIIIKAIYWFFKNLYIALRDTIMSAVDAANKNIKIVK